MAALVLLVVALGLREYVALLMADAPPVQRWAVLVLGIAFAVAVYQRPAMTFALAAVAMVGVGISTLLAPGEIDRAAGRLGIGVFGVFYLSLLVSLALLHRDLADGRLWVAVALGVTFCNDTGAYFVGRAVGRHKLAPAISPGKTVEGGVGGLAAGIGFMLAARATFFPAIGLLDCLVVGSGAGFLGPAGDLVESLLKRSVGAKDSGRLIPGHGGVLDRIDAVLFVGAFVYAYARYLR
jgi:phosphatidate cytidylyltransferase